MLSTPLAGAPAGPLARTLGRLVLRLTGWRVQGHLPETPRCVVIAAPHTSNWDLIYMLAVSYVLGTRPAWLGKRQLFWWPLGPVLRALGGIPVDRSKRNDLVRQVADALLREDACFLVIPPSGTRSRATHWRSGFYHIAMAARVPIVCSFLDYRRKLGGLGPIFRPTGDVVADMSIVRGFYAGITARRPSQVTPVRLQEEDVPAPIAAGR
jgi:1-acyl-sn-glycerol-3-phosphate acyltransferase